MYIDMDTKTIIKVRGREFIKNGKKMSDQILPKYAAKILAKRFNIFPCKEMNKRDERYWNKTGMKTKKVDNIMEVTYLWKEKMGIRDLKAIRIAEMERLYIDFYVMWRAEKDAKTFLMGENAEGQFIKNAYDKDLRTFTALKDYQEVIDFDFMKTIARDTVI